jgi:SAM-dependent methyltransferase
MADGPMATEATPDRWDGGADYEAYVGRWSRRVAEEFIDWLSAPAGRSWLDVGCGTGALAASIATRSAPACVVAMDRSADFVAHAAEQLDDRRVVFLVGDAASLPLAAASVDVVVSGLVLNFVPDPLAAVRELRRVARPGGTVAAYVWDYADGMQPIRAFWDAAIELDECARDADEAVRFPLCHPDQLRSLFVAAGLSDVSTRTIDVDAHFRDFDDYWTPFLSGVGPAPGYCTALPDDRREALRASLLARLSPSGSGPMSMSARAFAVRGTVPTSTGA